MPMGPSAYPRPARLGLAAALLLVTAGASRADPIQTYVALGDAIAFGQTGATPGASFGDQGYVKPFADFLATQNNGVRPNVINLALPGETSSTYFSAGQSDPGRQTGVTANLNYGGDPSLSQRTFLAGVNAAERAAGHVIGTLSFAVGLGDYLALTNSPGFSQLPSAQRQSMVQQLLTSLQSNYVTALTQIRGALPNASLYLPNYYNPYANLGPGDPNNQLFSTFVTGQDQIVRSLAPQFNGKVVDIMSTFAGNISNFTDPGSGFPYPNGAGYTAIANEAAAVAQAPEPGALTLLAVGAAGLVGRRCFRRRAAA
jgi:hypothetical protein